jgi:hypothetical protein
MSADGNIAAKGSITADGNLAAKGSGSFGGNLSVGDNVILDGNNGWILHTPNDGRKQMYVAPRTADGKDWDWSKQTQFQADGSVDFSNEVRLGSHMNLRGSNVVNFGSDLGSNKEVNAGKIGYGTFDGGATLNIVGAGKTGENRSVRVWENVMATNAIGVGDMPRDWRGANFRRADGRWTHFDFKDDGRNYIRGDTVVDGKLWGQIQRTCRDAATPWNDEGGGNAVFLDRHNVACNDDEMLSRFKLNRNGGGQYRYDYRCCKLG